MTARLLPPNATDVELALEAAAARISDVPVPIASLYSPEACPPAALPWLAWAEDAPVWRRAWDNQMRRGIVAASWRLHRLQGTLAGLKELARWAGAEVRGAVVPPGKRYAGRSYTAAERNAFVSAFPQLRIYRHRTRGTRAPGAAMARADYLGHTWPLATDAPARMAPRAYVYQDGVEHELVAVERVTRMDQRTSATATTIARRSAARAGAYLGRVPKWLVPSTAASRLWVLDVSTPYMETTEALRRQQVFPSVAPVTVHPDHVAEPGTASGLFAGGYLPGTCRQSTARARLYDRLYLFDAASAPGLRHAVSFVAGYLGMAPHRALLKVAIRGSRSARAVSRFAAGCLVATDRSALDTVRKALAWGQRVSDHVLMDTTSRRPLLAGASMPAGRVVAGTQVNA